MGPFRGGKGPPYALKPMLERRLKGQLHPLLECDSLTY